MLLVRLWSSEPAAALPSEVVPDVLRERSEHFGGRRSQTRMLVPQELQALKVSFSRRIACLGSLNTSNHDEQQLAMSENVNRLYPVYLFGGLKEIMYEKQQAQ
ncbi:hypothetical protein MJG53_009630 [Ovis ammon polii x Ovis aries]|uniref:Uncharacterized protein n=1 Tax=Ovis ammon polii x Ovis aries TaxID=2918886 RepID=A0ACB9UY41_9CETA|nr:hypothetical protein MJG53_009630 [Ovis ammon polii x Ovis aries]